MELFFRETAHFLFEQSNEQGYAFISESIYIENLAASQKSKDSIGILEHFFNIAGVQHVSNPI